MGRAGLPTQWDDAPVAVVVLLDEMLDSADRLEALQIARHQRGVERKRQVQAVGQRHGQLTPVRH
jgi:hypothetical protein